MKKIKMVKSNTLTLEEGCNKYLDNCRARNLREGTINHYRQTYVQFKKFFDMQMLVSDITEEMYQGYVRFLRATLHNDVSIKRLFARLHHNDALLDEGRVSRILSDASNQG